MELDKQVCSLDLAKRLKELGFKQDSLFGWEIPTTNNGGNIPIRQIDRAKVVQSNLRPELCDWSKKRYGGEHWAAFTVAELGQMLPFGISARKCLDGQWAYYANDNLVWPEIIRRTSQENDFNEADVRAKMLIYLLDHKLIPLS